MKKIILMSLTTLVLIGCETKEYKITVNFPDPSINGETVYLTSYDSGDTLQTVTVENQRCLLEGTIDTPYYARLLAGGKRIGFVVEPGIITLNAENGMAASPLNDKVKAISTRIEAIESDTTLTDEQIEEACSKQFKRAYEENSDNAIGPWAFYYYLIYNNFNETQIDSLLELAPAEYKQLHRVAKAKSDARQIAATSEGKRYIDFVVTTAEGKTMKLSDYAGHGRPVIVDFWASWCPPCRAEIPKLKTLKTRYGDRIEVVGVAVWDKPEDTRKAIDELGITWPVMMGTQPLNQPTDLYGVKGIPTIVVIDGSGTIVSRGLTGKALANKLEEIMKQ